MNKKHKHAELIKAWADGAEIEERYAKGRTPDDFDWVKFDGNWALMDDYDYRIKPELKPDFVTYYSIDADGVWWRTYQTDNMKPNIAVTFNGETGEPKSAEVLK